MPHIDIIQHPQRCALIVALILLAWLSAPLAQAQPVPPGIPADAPLVQLGLLDVTLYNGWQGHPVDPTGTEDSTAALQQAINDGYQYGFAVYLPAGTYLVSDTLRGEQIFQSSGCAEHMDDGTAFRIRKAPILLGPTSGPRPIIRLRDDCPGFDDPNAPRSVIHYRNVNEESGETDWRGDADCAMDLVVRRIDIEVGTGNPGAIGLQMASAQYSVLEDVRVDARGGYAGVRGLPTTNAVVNLEVIGGRFGVIPHSATTFIGLTLREQQETALLIETWNTTTVVGFDIELPQGPAIRISRGGHTAQLALIDGRISLGDGAAPAIDNAEGKDLYLANVFIQAPEALIQSGGQPTVAATGSWDLVSEYSYTNDRPATVSTGDITSYNLIEGVLGQDELMTLAPGASPPPADLVDQHVWHSVPSFEDPGVVNARDLGVVGDGVTDDTAALQAVIDAHDAIFLPRGDYVLSDTLLLRENTQLFGVPGERTRFYAPAWDPEGANAPLIRTANSAKATTYLGDLHLILPPGLERSYLEAIDWQSGPRSWARQVSVKTSWEQETTSHGRQLVRVRNNGGGRFYGLTLHTTASSRTRHKDFAFLLVDSTSAPLTFYGSNFEHVHNTHVVISGATNVRLLGMKTETMYTDFLRLLDSTNVMIAGHAGNGLSNEEKVMFQLTGSTDLLLALLEMYQSRRHSGGFMILEGGAEGDGATISLEISSNCSLYRRGQFNPSPFQIAHEPPQCGDGRCDPDEDQTSCPDDCHPDANGDSGADGGISGDAGGGSDANANADDDGDADGAGCTCLAAGPGKRSGWPLLPLLGALLALWRLRARRR